MKLIAIVIGAALGLAYAPVAQAQSDMPPLVHNPQITIDYQDPPHPIYGFIVDPDDARFAKDYDFIVKRYERMKGVRDRLIKRQLLEEFSQFLAPLRLPIKLRLITKQCGQVNAFYNQTYNELILCYEYVEDAELGAPKQTTPQGITRQDAIVGGVVGTLLHEAGHAVSNLLRLPVLGREEDAADQLAAYVMLQFGRDVARTLIKGEAYGWARKIAQPSRYWSTHSTSLQRLRLNLCLAFGSDPEGFEDFVVKFRWLPKARADNCANEYRQVQHAFRTTVLPHIDQDLLKKVRERKWLRPEDGTRQ